MLKQRLLLVTTVFIAAFAQFGHAANETYLRSRLSQAIRTEQDQTALTQLEERLPTFLQLEIPSNENVDKVFVKFKDAVRLIPATIRPETALDRTSAHELFPALQPIYRYVKDSVWKSIVKLVDLPNELLRVPAQNLAESSLSKLLAYSDDATVSKVLELNSNRQDFSDEQKSILVQNYIEKVKPKLNADNFQDLITQKLGASFLRYLPLNFLTKDPLFNDNSVIRNVATWLHLLGPSQRDTISNKAFRLLSDTTGRIGPVSGPARLANDDPSTLDMIVRMMPSLSTRQIISSIGDKIVPLLQRSSVQDDQSCTTALALLNRTLETKRSSNRYFRPDPKLVQRWQECYSGCDLRNLFSDRNDLKELLKHHPDPDNCEDLVSEVKKEYDLERSVTAPKLREVADAFGSVYRSDEINNLSDELMAELGRDEKILEKIGSQDLPPNEARAIINKIPRATQNLWGKNMLGKLGHLIPGLDNTILRQILTQGRGDLPSLFNHTSNSLIRKLVPSKIRLLIDQYATEPNVAKFRQLLASDYAKRYIKSETLMKILQMSPDVLRLVRFTPAQASAAISDRLGSEKTFDGSLGSLSRINNFINGLTKADVDKIKPEESLQAVQQVFGGARNKNIDNQMQSNTRFAFGNLLRRGLQTSEAAQNPDDYIKGLFRDDNLVDDLNPQIFTTMSNAELDGVNRLSPDQVNRFWTAVGSIREPVCCSLVTDNRFRLTDYALKHYGSATGEIDNLRLSQLGPFLASSLRASDIRRITTDALINKIQFFKSLCFQPNKAEAQALGARLNDALTEVDDNVKVLYLDLIGELAAYLPVETAVPKRVLSQRSSSLSKSLDKLQAREEKCKVPDSDGFLSQSIQGIKSLLVNAYVDQRATVQQLRERRQIKQGISFAEVKVSILQALHLEAKNFTCQDLRRIGSAISALSVAQLSSVADDIVYQCVGIFGAVNDYSPEKLRKIADKYLLALEARSRHIQSLSQAELYEINSILTGFTPGQLLLLRDKHFRDGNFLSFIGNLDGWTMEQLKSLAQLSLGNDNRLTPPFLENAGKILCGVDDQVLRRISPEDVKSYLSIFANIECPLEANVNYSSTMFDLVKNIYKGDILRPSIFGSLGTIAAGLKTADINALSPQLFNFFPSQALARVSPTFLKSLTSDQLQNLNVEQVKTIPNSLLTSLNRQQMGIINQILNPFKTSGASVQQSVSIVTVAVLPLLSMIRILQQ